MSRSRAWATAHFVYEAFVNGVHVGEAELRPGFAAYHSRIQMQAADVTLRSCAMGCGLAHATAPSRPRRRRWGV